MPIIERGDDGKSEMGFMRPNGLVGSKFEIYNNIDVIK